MQNNKCRTKQMLINKRINHPYFICKMDCTWLHTLTVFSIIEVSQKISIQQIKYLLVEPNCTNGCVGLKSIITASEMACVRPSLDGSAPA